jgi:hypothetical protein
MKNATLLSRARKQAVVFQRRSTTLADNELRLGINAKTPPF